MELIDILSVIHYINDKALIKLDRSVWFIRSYCFYMRGEIKRAKGKTVNLLPQNILKITNAHEEKYWCKYKIQSGLLEDIIKKKKPAYNALIWHNFYFSNKRRVIIKNHPNHMSSVNPTLTLHPEIFEELNKLITISKEVSSYYKNKSNILLDALSAIELYYVIKSKEEYMSIILKKGQFTTIGPEEIWKLYNNLHGIFRGGGNTKVPKLVRADGPRRKDLDVRIDSETGLEMVYPNCTKGLSFADSVEILAEKELEGHVWVIPKGKKIPGDLVFNIEDLDHPLLNVSKPMAVINMTALLTELANLMEPCDIKIGRHGEIIEKYPGALLKVTNI